MNPRQTGRLATRSRILREASILFAEKGYYGASTRDIADRVGIRQPSLFHHFPAKSDIMRELLMHDLAEPTRRAEAAVEEEGPASVRLYRYLVFDVRHVSTSPYDLTRISTEAVVADPDFAEARALMTRLHAARRTLIEEGVAAGEFIDIDPSFGQRAIMWMLRGILAEVAGRGVPDPDDFSTLVASLAIRALLTDPSRLDEIRQAATADVPETSADGT